MHKGRIFAADLEEFVNGATTSYEISVVVDDQKSAWRELIVKLIEADARRFVPVSIEAQDRDFPNGRSIDWYGVLEPPDVEH
jgi:hypothetical protein